MSQQGRFELVTQMPKPKKVGRGTLSIGKDGDADFFAGNADAGSAVLANMVRVRVEWAAATGILLSGMQPNGFDKTGRPKFTYQEWLLRYPEAA